MLDMVLNSAKLFFAGRLFADNAKAFLMIAIGVAITAILTVVLAKLGLPILIAAAMGGFFGGMLQPRLFKSLRFR
jgi:hypothetical protein